MLSDFESIGETQTDKNIKELKDKVDTIITDDYLNTLRKIKGSEVIYLKLSIYLSISSFIFTGLGSVLSFSSGYFANKYLAFSAGCSNVLALILMKASYFASSQSHFHDVKVRSILSKDYQFITQFMKDPNTIPIVSGGKIPMNDINAKS